MRILFLFFYTAIFSQVGIGTEQPDISSILEIYSKNKGLLIPRMKTQEKNNIQSPATSLMVYDNDLKCLSINKGTPKNPQWACLITDHTEKLLDFVLSYGSGDQKQIIKQNESVGNVEWQDSKIFVHFGKDITVENLDKSKVKVTSNEEDNVDGNLTWIFENEGDTKGNNEIILKLSGLKPITKYNITVDSDIIKTQGVQLGGFSFSFSLTTEGVEIPDPVFRNYLKNIMPDAFNDRDKLDFSHSRVKTLSAIDIDIFPSDPLIRSLKGIEYFTGLESLDIRDSNLESLDLSANTKLTDLTIFDDSIVDLDLSKNIEIERFAFYSDSVVSLDITGIREPIKPYFFNLCDVVSARRCSKLEELKINSRLKNHENIENIKQHKEDRITISTYSDKGKKICSDYDPRISKCVRR